MLRPDPSFWGRHFIVRQEVATCTGKLVPFSVALAVFDFGIHTISFIRKINKKRSMKVLFINKCLTVPCQYLKRYEMGQIGLLFM